MDERRADVAMTIHEQLGGRRFVAMTGATKFVRGERDLTFHLPGGITRGRGTLMRISLQDDDTYAMRYMRIRKLEPITIEQVEGVGVEVLRSVFTRMTGLDTSL